MRPRLKLTLQFVIVELTLSHPAEDSDDPNENGEIEGGDQVEEACGKRCPDDATECFESRFSS